MSIERVKLRWSNPPVRCQARAAKWLRGQAKSNGRWSTTYFARLVVQALFIQTSTSATCYASFCAGSIIGKRESLWRKMLDDMGGTWHDYVWEGYVRETRSQSGKTACTYIARMHIITCMCTCAPHRVTVAFGACGPQHPHTDTPQLNRSVATTQYIETQYNTHTQHAPTPNKLDGVATVPRTSNVSDNCFLCVCECANVSSGVL